MNDTLSLDICSTRLILHRITFLDSVNHFVVHTQAFSRLWKTSFYFFAGSSYDSCYIRFGFENLFLVSCLFFHWFSFSLWVLGGLFWVCLISGVRFSAACAPWLTKRYSEKNEALQAAFSDLTPFRLHVWSPHFHSAPSWIQHLLEILRIE